MGYLFRKSASFGPFRLNFSKSGIGASAGVKGARVTMNARGTTYVTVGAHGFYYRETFSNRGRAKIVQHSVPPQSRTEGDRIATADVSELVDSSSEELIQQLNERARMFNRAWLLYILAAAVFVDALSIVPQTTEPTLPPLPDVTLPFNADRIDNTGDEYAMLVARYGNPDSILPTDGDNAVPSRTAFYRPAEVRVTLVPNGCVGAYERATQVSQNRKPAKGEPQKTETCVPSPGWSIVGYASSFINLPISADAATLKLNTITVKRTADPTVETASSSGQQKGNSGNCPRKHQKPNAADGAQKAADLKPELQTDKLNQALQDQIRQRREAAWRNAWLLFSGMLALAFGVLAAGIVVHKKNIEKRRTRLVYELDTAEKQKYAVVQQALAHLSQSQRIWRIESRSLTADWKRNAGASSLVRRTPVQVGTWMPPRVEANIPVGCISVDAVRLFFLPDFILCQSNGRYGAVSYRDFSVGQSVTRFIEDEGVPGDATVVDRTWRYVNKNGGPDRRFNNNVQLPIAQYGMLVFASATGLNIHLHTSSAQQSAAFAQCWRELNGRNQRPQASSSRPHTPPPQSNYSPPHPPRAEADDPSTPRARALQLFGLNDGASTAEITAAYYRLAQQCHPDKVAGLAPEFQALADTKMKELNAAYKLLKP